MSNKFKFNLNYITKKEAIEIAKKFGSSSIEPLTYKGTWNASINTPTLSSGVGSNGDFYIVSVAGSTNLDGITDWEIGDWAVFNESSWQKLDNTDTQAVWGQITGTLSNQADLQNALNAKIDNDSIVNLDGTKLTNTLSTGIKVGGELTINAGDNTLFDISDGSGIVVDNFTDINNPTITEVSWTGLTGIAVTNLASQNLTYILLDNTGSVVQQATYPTDEQFRDYLFLGQLGHTSRTSIDATVSTPDVLASPLNQLMDLEASIGVINSGNIISPNGANLKIDKSVGTLFALGINFFNNNKNPNKKNVAAVTQATFRMRTQTGNGSTGNDLDVGNYDNAGTITALSGTKYTNFRVFLGTNENIVIQYGQVVYNSLANALAGIEQESFTIYENLENNFALVGIITAKSTTTNLSNNSDAFFSRTSKFGEVTGGTSGISNTDLQNAYNNSNEPEILTDSTRGAFTIRRGSADDTDNIIEYQNGAATNTHTLDGNGQGYFAQRIRSGVNRESLSANKSMVNTDKQSQYLDPNGADRDVTMFATPADGDYFLFKNIGSGGNSLVIKNNAGTEIITVANNIAIAVEYDGNEWQLV